MLKFGLSFLMLFSLPFVLAVSNPHGGKEIDREIREEDETEYEESFGLKSNSDSFLRNCTAEFCSTKDYKVLAGEADSKVEDRQRASYESAKAHKGRVFIKFTSVRCGPCQMLKPILENLKADYPDVKFVEVDISTATGQQLVQQYGVEGIPHYFLFNKGSDIESFEKSELEKTQYKSGLGYKPKAAMIEFFGAKKIK